MARDLLQHNIDIAKKRFDFLVKNYTGARFNNLEIVEFLGSSKEGFIVKLLCDCGAMIDRPFTRIKNNRIKSCPSCGRKRRAELLKVDMPVCKERLHSIWCNMKTRCTNKNSPSFNNYGARGIEICDLWLNSYEEFKLWSLNNGYDDSLSLDRVDNDGNYEPSNCRWTNQREQTLNSRVRSDNSTGERCISKLRGKYQLTIDGKYYGVYESIELAIFNRDSLLGYLDKRIV